MLARIENGTVGAAGPVGAGMRKVISVGDGAPRPAAAGDARAARGAAAAAAVLYGHRSTQMQSLSLEQRILLLQQQLGDHLARGALGVNDENRDSGGLAAAGARLASAHTRDLLDQLRGTYIALRDVNDAKARDIQALLASRAA